MTENVNGGATGYEDEDDFYDDAKALFPKAEHLAPSIPPKFGDGRLLAIWVTGKSGERPGKDGKKYTWVETLTLVLDNGPNGITGAGWAEEAAQIVPLVEADPIRLEKFQHSTGGLVGRLLPRITGKSPARHNDQGEQIRPAIPLKFRPLVGRLNTQPSANNKNVAAFSIAEPTDSDRTILRRFASVIKDINREMEEAETRAADSEAFDV